MITRLGPVHGLHRPFRSLAMLVLVYLLAGSSAAWARFAQPDTLFLATRSAEMEGLAREGVTAATTPRGAVEAIRRMLETRFEALSDLGSKLSLTGFDGIETQDRYDESVVMALQRVARAGVEADSTLPPQEEAVRFNAALGALPKLGPNPVGFMVLATAGAALAAADSLGDPAAGSTRPADRLALRFIRHITSDYAATREDFIRMSKAEAFRHGSIIMRMRCPDDAGTYQVVDMKNTIRDGGEIATIYFLKCATCGAKDEIRIRLEVASRLSEASLKQELEQMPTAKRPTPGLEP